MRRFFLVPALSAAGWLMAAEAMAQTTEYPPFPNPFPDSYGPGFYISITKVVMYLVIFWCWAYSTSWVNEDAQNLKLEPEKWNSIVIFAGVAGFINVFLLPWYILSYIMLLAAYGVPLGMYIKQRNENVQEAEQVFTKEHIRHWISQRMSMFGVKVKAEKKSREELIGLKIKPRGGATERDDRANGLLAKQNPGYLDTLEMVADALKDRAEQILLDVTAQGVSVRWFVDGMWEASDPLDREEGDNAVAVLKTLTALNVQDRRSRQESHLEIERGKRKYKCLVTSQGTKTGERVLLKFEDAGARFESLVDLGMREKMVEQLKALLQQKQGLLIISAPPAGGLTTTTHMVLNNTDRFMRTWVAVEDVNNRERPVDNIQVKTYNPAAGETMPPLLEKTIREYPDCYVVRDIPDADTLRLLLSDKIAGEDHLVVTCVKAKETAEGLLRPLTLTDAAGGRVSPAEYAPAVLGVLNQRMLRKLCDGCKEGFEPPPQLLQKLGLPADRVPQLFKQHTPDPEDKKDFCDSCGNRGYKGRTAIFELMVLNDEVRQVLATTPRLDVLRNAARKAGMKTMQEEGILLVAKGVTSLEELKRVMQEGQAQ